MVVEVVAPRTPGEALTLPGLGATGGDTAAPATLSGLVVVVPSLGSAQAAVGEGLGAARPAIQGGGRTIAPVKRGAVLGLSLIHI